MTGRWETQSPLPLHSGRPGGAGRSISQQKSSVGANVAGRGTSFGPDKATSRPWPMRRRVALETLMSAVARLRRRPAGLSAGKRARRLYRDRDPVAGQVPAYDAGPFPGDGKLYASCPAGDLPVCPRVICPFVRRMICLPGKASPSASSDPDPPRGVRRCCRALPGPGYLGNRLVWSRRVVVSEHYLRYNIRRQLGYVQDIEQDSQKTRTGREAPRGPRTAAAPGRPLRPGR